MNDRRKIVIALCAGAGALALPLRAFAQQQGKLWRIGLLGMTSIEGFPRQVEALRAGLRELGYVEGKNLVIEFRWAEGKYDRLPALAAELVGLNVDLIVTHTTATLVAKQASATIPIVMATDTDPVGSGLVASLARPGGNVTGSAYFYPELNAKRLELLKELYPRIRRVAVLLNSGSARYAPVLQAMEVAAASLKIELQQFGVRSPDEFENAFAAMSKRRVEAVAILEEPMVYSNVDALSRLAMKNRIPATGFVEVAETGGLIGYGVNFPVLWHRAAYFVDRILKGTKPADLPVEQPTNFEMVINMKTARALGVRIPLSLRVRADRVIE